VGLIMNFESVVDLLWDGDVHDVQVRGRDVTLTLSGAQMDPELVPDINILTTGGNVYGKLYLEDVRSDEFLEIVSQVQPEKYDGILYGLSWTGKAIEFEIMWEPIEDEQLEFIPLFCTVEVGKVYWENQPQSTYCMGPPIAVNTSFFRGGCIDHIEGDYPEYNRIQIWMRSPKLTPEMFPKGFIPTQDHRIEGYLGLMWVLQLLYDGKPVERPFKLEPNEWLIHEFTIKRHELFLKLVNSQKNEKTYEAVVGGITWVDSYYTKRKPSS